MFSIIINIIINLINNQFINLLKDINANQKHYKVI